MQATTEPNFIAFKSATTTPSERKQSYRLRRRRPHCQSAQARKVVEDVAARLAAETEAETIDLVRPTCVIELQRVSLSDGGQPVEATRMVSPAAGRRLRYEITP
ncbi:hypothetical protein [Promicromonospora aerolata]|uniref:UTRA domain-containing protein n=1 Tax=Promicromonospora aerolata TaxID=195749 RepID=A0ABW4VCF8_9MICO